MKNRIFSQEMASSSPHNNNGISLATVLEWYKIRDTFLGDNFVSQNIPLAIEMAASCQHPDALWLTKACAGKDMTTEEEAKRVFFGLGQNDARALFFAWRCCTVWEQEDLAPLRRSAEFGYAFAESWMAGKMHGEERFRFAHLSTVQGERDGFYWLGQCFRLGEDCASDLRKATENLLIASELGDVFGMRELGELLIESDPERWRWWGRAAGLGNVWSFLLEFAAQVELFNSGAGSAAVMFAIGHALHGHVNEQARTIFKHPDDFDSLIGPAKQAIAFYEAQIKASKDAMRAWTLVGIKLKVVKDVRKLIAKLVWDSREEALFHS
jgi:TPR repeat protein